MRQRRRPPRRGGEELLAVEETRGDVSHAADLYGTQRVIGASGVIDRSQQIRDAVSLLDGKGAECHPCYFSFATCRDARNIKTHRGSVVDGLLDELAGVDALDGRAHGLVDLPPALGAGSGASR